MQSLFIIRGKVKTGMKRGRALGFPTANIELHQTIPEGIYASVVIIKNQEYKAATFIGTAKTFGEKDYKAETYIFDFDQNIYDKWITVKLYQKIRGNKKFPSEEQLILQIKEDIEQIQKILLLNS